MTYKLTILGSGAAPGVPSVTCGWGVCDPTNGKNCRSRTTSCLEYAHTRILIDTSPDLRMQLLNADIRRLDGIVYTHAHADHLHGIDELREINRAVGTSLDFYAADEIVQEIKNRFSYLLATREHTNNISSCPSLIANPIKHYQSFMINNELKVTPIRLKGHNMPTTGYVFNDGEMVYIADYREIEEEAFAYIRQPVKVMVVPLTTVEGGKYHAGFEEIMRDIKRIAPQRAVINHMAVECDFEQINRMTPENVAPAFDGMTLFF